MGVLHRYIFKQVLGTAIATVALFVFVLVVGNVMKSVMEEFASGRIDFKMFTYIILLIIPGVIPYALPMGMLTGILLVFGRMSAQSEIVAIKASGRSLYDIAAPVFFLSICASLFSVLINFYYAPVADTAYKSLIKNAIRTNPLQFIKPGNFIRDFPGMIIYANSAQGNKLIGFNLRELDKQGNVIRTTEARTAEIVHDEENDEIVIQLGDGVANERGSASKQLITLKYKGLSGGLSLDEIIGSKNKTKEKLTLMTFGELMDVRHTWNPKKLDLSPEEKFRNKIAVQNQIQKNFAMAFSIFAMTVFAIPLGIKASRSETFANLGIAIALAMTYYMMTVIITWFEKFPHLRPDIIIWTPNILFMILGIILMRRASKH